MQLSYEFIREAILERFDWEHAPEYGEPGYSFRPGATTPLVVFGNYWCRCDKFIERDGTYNDGKPKLHTKSDHWPKVFDQLEEQGVEFEWEDEWIVDWDHGKAYRSVENSYTWQKVWRYTDAGDMLTPDDDLDEWIEEMVNDPQQCLPSAVWSENDLIEAGWEQYNGEFQNGLHPGMDDDPKAITETIHRDKGDVDIVFLLDEASQFYIGFSAWIKEKEGEEE